MSTRDIRPSLHHTVCDVCGRTLLRGEHAEAYIDGGERRWVCDLCVTRALEDGWVREGTAPEVDRTDYPRERRRPLRQLLRGLRPPSRETDGDVGFPGDRLVHETSLPAPAPEGPREPRHVHAVPTSAEQRVSSAVRVFNGSEHTRTIAGVARSLGPPEVTVKPSDVQPAVV